MSSGASPEGKRFRDSVARTITGYGISVQKNGYKWILMDAVSKANAETVVASYHPGNRMVHLNQRHSFWKYPDRTMALAYSRKTVSSADRMHPAYQEIAHGLHHAAVGDVRYAELRVRSLGEMEQVIALREVSIYSARSAVEFVAEVFAGIKAGKVYPEEVLKLYNVFGGPTP